MKIVRDPTNGWYVLQESLDTRSTVEGERSEDENGHVMLLPEIEFDYDLPVQVEAPILQLEMDEFLANANEDGDSQEGGTLRHDDYYPDSNLFSLFNESDFISDNDQADRVKSPLYSTTNRSTFDGELLVDLTANFGTSQTVNVSTESIRGNQLVENSSSGSDSSSSESSSSKSCSKLPSSKLPSSESPSSDSSSSESEFDSDYNFSDSNVEYYSSSSDSSTVVQKRYRRKRLVKTAKRRERVRQRHAAMTPEKLEKIRKAKRDYKRNRLARMSEQELQKYRERVREYDRLWRKKNPGKKAEYSRKNASSSKLQKKGELPPQKKKTKNKKQRSQMSAEELEKLRKAQRDQKRNRLAQMTEQERQAHRQRVREYDRLWREKNPGKKAEYSRKVISNVSTVVSQMSSEELEQRRRTQREKKRNQLAQMTEEERQKRRERIREYDRLWREKKKAEFARKNASSSKLPQKDEFPLQKKKTEDEKQQNGATVDLFEARRLRKNAQTRMRRRAALASETPEQREERLRKRREQARNRKEMLMLQAKVGQPEVENHFLQMASMITSKQLTEHRNRKRKHRDGGNDPDYRPKLGDVHKRRQRPSMVDYSDSDD